MQRGLVDADYFSAYLHAAQGDMAGAQTPPQTGIYTTSLFACTAVIFGNDATHKYGMLHLEPGDTDPEQLTKNLASIETMKAIIGATTVVLTGANSGDKQLGMTAKFAGLTVIDATMHQSFPRLSIYAAHVADPAATSIASVAVKQSTGHYALGGTSGFDGTSLLPPPPPPAPPADKPGCCFIQ